MALFCKIEESMSSDLLDNVQFFPNCDVISPFLPLSFGVTPQILLNADISNTRSWSSSDLCKVFTEQH